VAVNRFKLYYLSCKRKQPLLHSKKRILGILLRCGASYYQPFGLLVLRPMGTEYDKCERREMVVLWSLRVAANCFLRSADLKLWFRTQAKVGLCFDTRFFWYVKKAVFRLFFQKKIFIFTKYRFLKNNLKTAFLTYQKNLVSKHKPTLACVRNHNLRSADLKKQFAATRSDHSTTISLLSHLSYSVPIGRSTKSPKG
jgi:hypothetical protein